MANKTFKVAGITTHNGNDKVRVGNDLVKRIKIFSKGGASRVDLIELPSEMDKISALKYLLTREEFQSPSDQATISECLEDRTKDSLKGVVKVKVTKEKVKPSMDAIKARSKKKAVTAEELVAAADLHNVDPA